MKHFDTMCFGGNDWWYHNRNHFDIQILRRFAQYGNVIYINSIVMQKPNLSRGGAFISKVIRKSKSIFKGLHKVDGSFWVYSPFSLPVHHIAWAKPLNKLGLQFQLRKVNHKLGIRNPVVWVACPAVCDVAIEMKKNRLIYQRTDCFEEFPNIGTRVIRDYDLKLKAAADLTLFVNGTLYEKESYECRKAIYLDHGVDYEMFASVELNNDIPTDIANIPKPIVGFFGQIEDHTVDIGFLEKVIDYLPEISFVFIGGIDADCSGLLAKKNVWMLGQKPYEQIPHYGKCFDVAIMPWRQNRWIEACNPIKLKEYLALGLPTVSTPFTELRKYSDVVYEARSPEDFAKCIEKALAEDSPERVASRRKKVETSTWDNKAQMVLQELFRKNSDCQEHN